MARGWGLRWLGTCRARLGPREAGDVPGKAGAARGKAGAAPSKAGAARGKACSLLLRTQVRARAQIEAKSTGPNEAVR